MSAPSNIATLPSRFGPPPHEERDLSPTRRSGQPGPLSGSKGQGKPQSHSSPSITPPSSQEPAGSLSPSLPEPSPASPSVTPPAVGLVRCQGCLLRVQVPGAAPHCLLPGLRLYEPFRPTVRLLPNLAPLPAANIGLATDLCPRCKGPLGETGFDLLPTCTAVPGSPAYQSKLHDWPMTEYPVCVAIKEYISEFARHNPMPAAAPSAPAARAWRSRLVTGFRNADIGARFGLSVTLTDWMYQ